MASLIAPHITAGPICDRVHRINKYGAQVAFLALVYEWDGSRIMYVRVNPNCDHCGPYEDHFNGFSIQDTMEVETPGVWRSDTEGDSWLLEKTIDASTNKGVGSIADKLAHVPIQYWPIVLCWYKDVDTEQAVSGVWRVWESLR